MPFITHKKIAKKYILKIGLKSIDQIDDQNSFWIIKTAYYDFKKETLSFDDFSTLGEFLFNKLTNKNKPFEFGNILLIITELSDNIRNTSSINDDLKRIDRYFSQYQYDQQKQ